MHISIQSLQLVCTEFFSLQNSNWTLPEHSPHWVAYKKRPTVPAHKHSSIYIHLLLSLNTHVRAYHVLRIVLYIIRILACAQSVAGANTGPWVPVKVYIHDRIGWRHCHTGSSRDLSHTKTGGDHMNTHTYVYRSPRIEQDRAKERRRNEGEREREVPREAGRGALRWLLYASALGEQLRSPAGAREKASRGQKSGGGCSSLSLSLSILPRERPGIGEPPGCCRRRRCALAQVHIIQPRVRQGDRRTFLRSPVSARARTRESRFFFSVSLVVARRRLSRCSVQCTRARVCV